MQTGGVDSEARPNFVGMTTMEAVEYLEVARREWEIGEYHPTSGQ